MGTRHQEDQRSLCRWMLQTKGCSPLLGIMRQKDHIHLELTIAAVFPTTCWKMPKNEVSIDKSRTERRDKGNREMRKFQWHHLTARSSWATVKYPLNFPMHDSVNFSPLRSLEVEVLFPDNAKDPGPCSTWLKADESTTYREPTKCPIWWGTSTCIILTHFYSHARKNISISQ